MKVPYGYLPIQLDPNRTLGQAILNEWREELSRCYFTLGPAVERLETAWAQYCGVKHAIGVNSGTDALIISMKALGIGPGDEVITCPNTFVATVGAIVALGAKPVFVDAGPDYLIDMVPVYSWVGSKTKAVIPVDLTGRPSVHGWRGLKGQRPFIIRDACQSIGATYNGTSSGRMAHLAAYSLHPLKNVHGCGDGGIIVTDNDEWAEWIRLYRNHGLKDRDTVMVPGINSRLDTLQAIAAWYILQDVENITTKRNHNAAQYREGLAGIEEVTLPPLDPPGTAVRQAYHTFVILAERRDHLKAWLLERGIQVAIHYPVPVHLQKGYQFLGYRKGDFPNVEYQADHMLTLPIHEYLTEQQIDYVIDQIKSFYGYVPSNGI